MLHWEPASLAGVQSEVVVGEVDGLVVVHTEAVTVHIVTVTGARHVLEPAHLPVGQVAGRLLLLVAGELLVVGVGGAEGGAGVQAGSGGVARGAGSLPVRQLVVHVVEVEARPLGLLLVAALVVVRLLLVALLAQLLLLAFRGRHLRRVLFPPFRSSVLEPDLRKKENVNTIVTILKHTCNNHDMLDCQ